MEKIFLQSSGNMIVLGQLRCKNSENFLIRHSKDTKNKLYPIRKFYSLEEISISLIIYLDTYLF